MQVAAVSSAYDNVSYADDISKQTQTTYSRLDKPGVSYENVEIVHSTDALPKPYWLLTSKPLFSTIHII